MTGNTVLITGGGSGIGGGLAHALHEAGNRVVIAGRRRESLRAMVTAHPGMEYLQFDQGDTDALAPFAAEVARRYPDLNVLVNNAAMMRFDDVTAPDVDVVLATVVTNLVGPVLLTGALLPTLRTHSREAVVNVTSALAFVPMADAATYCASKAGLHSITESLRIALRDSGIAVIEIPPPRVATDMQRDLESDPDTMELDDFVTEVMAQLDTGASEIVVPAARLLREAERKGDYDEVFAAVNSERETS